MNHKLQKGLVVFAAALMLLGTLATTAYADLDSEPADGLHGASNSNPGAGVDYWWRGGWGTTLYPDFILNPPDGMDSKVDGWIIGMLYSVDRTPALDETIVAGVIDTSTPEAYYRANFGSTTENRGPYGTNANNTIDMLGIFANPPGGGWPPSDPAAAQPVEGRWFLHYRYMSSLRYSTRVHTVGFGIDTTPPNPVAGLTIRTGVTSSAVTTWQPLVRAHISWTPNEYDALSGVGYYEVLVDDKPIIPEKNTLPDQGRVYSAPWLPTPSSITVENMPPGAHKISIVCVDRATNRSTATSGYYYSDPDTPTVSFTSPVNGLLKASTYISVDASDSAGSPGVKVALDATNIATFTAPPYRFLPNLTGVTPGAHVLSATVTDKLGRSVTTTMAVSTTGAAVIPADGFIVSDDEVFNALMTGTTTTHPEDPLSDSVFWRQGWGNSLNPQFSITPPAPDVATFGFIGGMMYVMDRSVDTTIDPTNVSKYYRSSTSQGTNLDQTVDLMGVFSYPPLGGWPASAIGGESTPYEGYWYFHFLPFTTKGYAPSNTSTIRIGVDVTKPRSVTGLVASPSLYESLSGSWSGASRAKLTWLADRYDDLSGVAYYKVLLDGVPVIPEGSDNKQGRVYEVFGRIPTSVTIENMPAGKHKLSVVAVDRATNEGPAASTYFYSDPDTPTVQFGSFSRTVGSHPTFSVITSDAAGIRNVVYRLDGTWLGTQTQSPFSISADLGGFSSGTHTLTATASDQLGRPATASTTITLDKTPVKITNFSRTPSIFYPIIREGYKDNSTLKFTLNKSASVKLTVKNSSGSTVRTITKSFGAGSRSMTWDGKWSSDGKAHTGTFKYQLRATDNVGNVATSVTLSTTIRNYELVQTGAGAVKVVPR
jgi:hypothetical protein